MGFFLSHSVEEVFILLTHLSSVGGFVHRHLTHNTAYNTFSDTISRVLPRRPSNSHIQHLMSHMLGRCVEQIWVWGRVPATCKADSVRRGDRQKPTNPILQRHRNNFHMVFKQKGAVIYVRYGLP